MLFPLEQQGSNCIAWLKGEFGLNWTCFSRFGPRSGTGGVLDGLARSTVYTNKKNEVTIYKRNIRGTSGVQALIRLISDMSFECR
jgi:hypothetical protein